MIAPEEEQIRRLFDTAKQLEESQAPGFQTTVARARRRAVSQSHRKVLAAVTVMVLFALLSVLVITRTKKESDLPSPHAVLYWESPTQAYLSPPGEALLTLMAEAGRTRADRSEP